MKLLIVMFILEESYCLKTCKGDEAAPLISGTSSHQGWWGEHLHSGISVEVTGDMLEAVLWLSLGHRDLLLTVPGMEQRRPRALGVLGEGGTYTEGRVHRVCVCVRACVCMCDVCVCSCISVYECVSTYVHMCEVCACVFVHVWVCMIKRDKSLGKWTACV